MMDGWTGSVGEEIDDMARDTTKTKAADASRVQPYVGRLVAVQRDRPAFETVLSELTADKALSVADVIEIALLYRGGGSRPTSRKVALEIISKRFLELIRIKAQIAQAAKARPW
jgi:hypothetical protein